MCYFEKKLIWLGWIMLWLSGGLFFSVAYAADAQNQNLQQQLQSLQQAMQQNQAAQHARPPQSAGEPSAQTAAVDNPFAPTGGANAGVMPNRGMDAPNLSTNPQTNPNVNNPQVDEESPEAILGGTDLRSQAFNKVVNTSLPLSPAQIRLLRNMYDETQQAAVIFPGVPPRPTASSIMVNLSPGATPPVVRLGAGFVTSLVFVDSTGSPWPVESYSLGNPTAFNIQWDKKSNILLVQAITSHRVGNLAVLLKGLNTPVMVTLSPGQTAMDMRVDMRIPGLGPQAKPNFDALPGTESPALLALLDGIPPAGAKLLKTTACENCAWLVDKKLYLRTMFTVVSPAWVSTMSSADGTHVYEMQPTPLVLTSYNGKMVQIKIEGF